MGFCLLKQDKSFVLVYRISCNKRPQYLFNFQVLRCSAYRRTALKKRRGLFQSHRNYLREISKLSNLLSPNDNS